MLRPNPRQGFTLIELMVALVILSILMGFAIPEVIHLIEQSKKQTQLQNEKAINKALQDYFADHGRYPESLSALVNATHPYFEEIPIDPISGRADAWLVTNKSIFMTSKKFYTQGEFPAKDPSREGIYRIKARR